MPDIELASYQGQREITEAINNLSLSSVPQKAVWFDNVASMVAYDLPVGVTAATRGYHTVNDGGGASYYIREVAVGDVEDGGSIIFLDNGNVAELITDGTVTPEQFGAYGDGTHDDTTAISNALKMKKVHFLHKTYNITSILADLSNCELTGDNATIKCTRTVVDADNKFDVLGNYVISSTDTSFDNGKLYMSGITLDANADQYEWSTNPDPNHYCGLSIENFEEVLIENCTIKNTLMVGFHGHFCNKVTVKNCRFYDIGTVTGKGSSARPFSSNGWQWEGISCQGWKNVNGTALQRTYHKCEMLTVENCYFEGILNGGVGSQAYSKIYVNNNKFYDMHAQVTEFHSSTYTDGDGVMPNTIDFIEFNNNEINYANGVMLSYSGTWDSAIKTVVNVMNNRVNNLYGIKHLDKDGNTTVGNISESLMVYNEVDATTSVSLNFCNNVIKYFDAKHIHINGNIVKTVFLDRVHANNNYIEVNDMEDTYKVSTVFQGRAKERIIDNLTYVTKTNTDTIVSSNGVGEKLTLRNVSVVLNDSATLSQAVLTQQTANLESVIIDNVVGDIGFLWRINAGYPNYLKLNNNKVTGSLMQRLSTPGGNVTNSMIFGNIAGSNNIAFTDAFLGTCVHANNNINGTIS